MHQTLVIYTFVVVLIGIMLFFCMDVIRKSNKLSRSSEIQTKSVAEAEEILTTDENPLVYPLYVDCSREILVS